MKKLVGFFILLIAAGGGWWYWVKYGTPPEKPQVVQVTVSRGEIVEAVQATGALEPIRRFDVGSQVSGVVQALYVDYNSIVKKGQLLAEIDPQLLQVQVDIQEANIARQQSDIANQKVQLEDQKKQFERTKSLFDRGLQNQQQFETAALSIKTREAQIASSEKSLVSAEASLNSARLNVGYTKIVAPADGVVVERRVDVGQTVQASTTTPSFFVLATPLQNLKLTAGVDEAEIGKIRPGMEVRFNVDSYPGKTFYGTVENVRLNATNQSNVVTYPVWITVPNPRLELRPSMTATLRIVLSTAANVVRIPNQATRFRPNNDIYLALGMTPPAAGQPTRLADAGTPEANANAATGRGTGRTGQAAGATPAPGQTAQRGQTAQPGGMGGRGQGSDLANMTPAQRQALTDSLARAAGRGGAGGRGGQSGGRAQTAGGRGGGRGAVQVVPPVNPNADKIDQLWAQLVKVETPGTVWKWDEANKTLTSVRVRLGATDGSFMELISGDINIGDQIVTGVILPASAILTRPGANPLLQQQRGGMNMGGGGGGGGRGGGRGGN